MSRIEQSEQLDTQASKAASQASLALFSDANPWGPRANAKAAGTGTKVAEVGPEAACFGIHRLDTDNKTLVHDLYIEGYGLAGTFDGMAKRGCAHL